ncbi:hypothetical protein LEMLEM_LOCUS7056, partial [Lemmus lemmus]
MQRKQFGVKQIKGGETALSCHVWTLFTLPRKRRDSDLLLPRHPNRYCWKFCLQSVLYGNNPQLNKHIPQASQCLPAPTCTND